MHRSLRSGMAVVLAGMMALAGCSSKSNSDPKPTTDPSQPQQGGELVLAMRNDPSTLDPQGSASVAAVSALNQMYDSLVFLMPDGSFKPWLATKWEISPDGKVYTFDLRKDVKFHDGTPFTAEAVKVTIDRIFDPATGSTSAKSGLGPWEKTEIVNDQQVKIHLKTPFAPFLFALSQSYMGIVSPAQVKKVGNKDFLKNPVGTGPFKFKEMVPQDHITLERNPDYNWPPEGVFEHKGPAMLDKITIRTVPESQTRLTTLQNGEAQIIDPVPEQDAASLRADKQFGVINAMYPGAGRVMLINTQKFPTNDIAVRRAIVMGVDTGALVKSLFAGEHPIGRSPLTSATLGYDKKFESVYPFDVAKAKKTLDDAGWKAGSDGIRVKDGKRLELEFYNQANAGLDTVAEFLQAQLRQLGMDVKIKALARAAWYESMNKGDHNLQSVFFYWADPDVLRQLYSSKNIPFNWSHLTDAGLDQKLEAAYQETDATKRLALIDQIQQIIMEQAPVLPLFYENHLLGVSNKLKGVKLDASTYVMFYGAYLVK